MMQSRSDFTLFTRNVYAKSMALKETADVADAVVSDMIRAAQTSTTDAQFNTKLTTLLKAVTPLTAKKVLV